MNPILGILSALNREPELEPTRHPLSEEAQMCYWASKAAHDRLRKQAEACMEEAKANAKRFWQTIEEMHPETRGRNITISDGGSTFRFEKEDGVESQPTCEPPAWVAELLAGDVIGNEHATDGDKPAAS